MLTAVLTVESMKSSELRFFGGAKGTRTPDPHTASVVRYQLRHSPKSCQSKLHHLQPSFKTAGQSSSSAAKESDKPAPEASTTRVSGPRTQPKAATSSTIPLITKLHP